jgi:hypothetical protein
MSQATKPAGIAVVEAGDKTPKVRVPTEKRKCSDHCLRGAFDEKGANPLE